MNIILYIIEGIATRKRYVRITNYLQRRLKEHRNNHTKGGQITGEFRLLHKENFHEYSSAREREKFLKSGKGRQWIKDNVTKTRPA
jgi:putative endonuclease